jgi:1-deoxy-D-xylulose-5-phosphate reductoisomerase
MGVPILYALSYPERRPTPAARLDFPTMGPLTFFAPDTAKFRCLVLARQALEMGGTAPVVLNAANEVAVKAFLDRRIRFLAIAETIEQALNAYAHRPVESIEECVAVDTDARRSVQALIDARAGGTPS